MKTTKLYYTDAYLKEFQSVITDITENSIVLEKTAFFPEGGGQSSDIGTLGECEIYDVQEINSEIHHFFKGSPAYKKGDVITGKINFEKRFSDMQQHSGEHIVSGLAHKMFGCDNVGFHLGSEVVTLDLNRVFTYEEIVALEKASNNVVTSNKKITGTFPDKATLSTLNFRSKKEISEDLRIVEIQDTDICACCAPHVSMTGEIGLIKIVDYEKHRGGTRISILCGQRAMEDYRIKQEQNRNISIALKVKEYETYDGVRKLLSRKADLDFENGSLNREIANLQADAVEPKDKIIAFTELTGSNLTIFSNKLKEKASVFAAVFSQTEEDKFQYVISSNSIDVRDLCKEMNSKLNGKGGGKPMMVQGTLNSNKEQIIEFFGRGKGME